jgi:hypothetical protein
MKPDEPTHVHVTRPPVERYTIGEYRESLPVIGVVTVVSELHGKCGCGEVEMKSEIAFFREKADAELFVKAKNAAASVTANDATPATGSVTVCAKTSTVLRRVRK